MKRGTYLAAILLVGLLSACGSAGKDFDPALAASVQNGKTSKEEIRSLFGTPFKTGIQNGKEIWIYEYNTYSALGPDTSKDFIIVFDDRGVVTSHQLMTSNPE